jgi:hypothetical protein
MVGEPASVHPANGQAGRTLGKYFFYQAKDYKTKVRLFIGCGVAARGSIHVYITGSRLADEGSEEQH